MMNDNKPEWTKLKKNKKFVSKGFQHFRDVILSRVEHLSFSAKFNIIKKADRELLEIINTHQGTKNVHSLDYVHKFPSRNRNLTAKDEIYLLWRCIKIAEARDEYYATRRKSMIREIK